MRARLHPIITTLMLLALVGTALPIAAHTPCPPAPELPAGGRVGFGEIRIQRRGWSGDTLTVTAHGLRRWLETIG